MNGNITVTCSPDLVVLVEAEFVLVVADAVVGELGGHVRVVGEGSLVVHEAVHLLPRLQLRILQTVALPTHSTTHT